MPFIHDQSDIEWPEDGSDAPDPRVSDFVYLPAPEYGGPREPVRFSLQPPASESTASPGAVEPQRRSILDRLLGRRTPQSRVIRDHERRRQLLFATLVPPLRTAGAKRAYCRYDGGNDEGFSWLDHYESESGDRLDLDALAARLLAMGVHDQLPAIEARSQSAAIFKHQKLAELRDVVSDQLVEEWAMLLLGRGFGTGEYCMYGAFWVDLEACTIIDDGNADPVVQNITIAG